MIDNPDLPLPSLRSLGLLSYDPSLTGWEEVPAELPPLRLGPDTKQETPEGKQPPQETQHYNPLQGIPEAGNMLEGADEMLVPVGIHPQMAGEGGTQGGGGLVYAIEFYELQEDGTMVMVEINQW